MKRRAVVYLRVSSRAQRTDLANQRARLEEFCAARGLAVDEWCVHSPDRETVEDLMAIIHGFSARLDVLRHYRKSLAKALRSDAEGAPVKA